MTTRRVHPLVPELKNAYFKGRISRREFMRYGALLGLSVSSLRALAGSLGRTASASSASVRRGGTIRVGLRVMRADHPARFSWVAQANVLRNVLEYLTYTDRDNITHPYLLESWEPSDDLKTWTLRLRRGITWNNGDPFTADDVVFTMKQWLDPEVGSSILGLMSYLRPDNIEKVDDYTVRLHLDAAQLAVPEHLFHYPAQVLHHRSFEGDILQRPVGTGPYTVQEWVEGERVVLKRREGYLRNGVDGQPLPYLDEVVYVDLGQEVSAYVAAFQSGSIDFIDFGDLLDLEAWRALRNHPQAVVDTVNTGQTRVLRVRVDRAPWNDPRVRQALFLCQNREKIRALAYFGEGAIGQDCHAAPVHPDYMEVPTPEYDPARARQLLAEAGYPNGLDVTMIVSTGWPDVVRYAEILQEDARAAGFRIQLNPVPISVYWDQWTEVDLGITPWTHRPLATMTMRLAYTVNADGNPGAWNETRWYDQEFQDILDRAEMTIDLEERRRLVGRLQAIQQERGSIGIAYWRPAFTVIRRNFHGISAHPTHYYSYHEVWRES